MVSAGGWAGEAFGRNRYREYKLLRDQDLGRGIKKKHPAVFRPKL